MTRVAGERTHASVDDLVTFRVEVVILIDVGPGNEDD